VNLIPLRQYLGDNPHTAREVWNLVREALAVSSIQSIGDVTDEQIQATLEEPTSFWRAVPLPNGKYQELLGVVGLQKFNAIDGTGEIAVAVFQDFRGKGFGVCMAQAMRGWAVANLNLRRLTEFVVAGSRGAAMARLQGDTLEGTLKAFKFKDGSYVDVEVYSWLRDGG
jgi:RimJ/RimL family protein N-acetyltransferase